jgi:hypothetical protein
MAGAPAMAGAAAMAAAPAPAMAGAARPQVVAPRTPHSLQPTVQPGTPAAGSGSKAYGDWTKPSRPVDDELLAGPVGARVPVAPLTTAIPERSGSARERFASYDDEYLDDADYADDYADEDYYDDEPIVARAAAPAAVRGPVTGPAVGGRAAKRAERQAAELARQKAAKRNGVHPLSASEVLEAEEMGARKPRRVAKSLIALVVLALCALGAYSYLSPKTSTVSSTSKTSTGSGTAGASAATTSLPPLATAAVPPAAPAATAPVRVPVTVLNATTINGLAAKVSGVLSPKGWTAGGVGSYKAGDVSANTVFFTQGDEKQREAAVQLVDQFPQLTGPAVRFFQLPAGVTAPGLVVVLTSDWKG